jgi:hypothetical protein
MIRTASTTTKTTPTNAQSQIPPPIQLLINLPAWFIIKRLLLRRDQSD